MFRTMKAVPVKIQRSFWQKQNYSKISIGIWNIGGFVYVDTVVLYTGTLSWGYTFIPGYFKKEIQHFENTSCQWHRILQSFYFHFFKLQYASIFSFQRIYEIFSSGWAFHSHLWIFFMNKDAHVNEYTFYWDTICREWAMMNQFLVATLPCVIHWGQLGEERLLPTYTTKLHDNLLLKEELVIR